MLALRVRNKDGLRATNGLIPLTLVTLLQINSRISQAYIYELVSRMKADII